MAHFYTAYRCKACTLIPDIGPIYYCENKHQYCSECFKKLQRLYTGTIPGAASCALCTYDGLFVRCDVDPEFLKKLKMKPGIGRPYRYGPKKGERKEANNTKSQTNCESTPKNDPKRAHGDCLGTLRLPTRSLSASGLSRRPLNCLHDGCKKSIAVYSLVNHFRHDHHEVPQYNIVRGTEQDIEVNVFEIECDRTKCLAMMTVYEVAVINVSESKSDKGVVEAAKTLSREFPINTFWLMITGPDSRHGDNAYVVYWLYSNSEEHYLCTIELSSRLRTTGIMTLCHAVGLHEGCTTDQITRSLNCLIVSRGHFVAFLCEGGNLTLRINVI